MQSGPSAKNVVMIVSDTLRSDYLGANGGPAHTPNLDELAASSVRFRNYHAASFPTLPARADFLTGAYSFTGAGWGPLPRAFATVPELLGAAGVVTAAVVDTPFYVVNGYHYDRGFEFFYEVPGQRADNPHAPVRPELLPNVRATEADYCPGRTITTAEHCLEFLRGQRFFLYVDLWDPHEPWDPPEWYVRRYKPDYDGRVVSPPYGPYFEWGLSDDDLETARACYCGEITMVDRWIGRLLERLESLGIADETAVIFVSDHGFYFGERGGILGKMTRSRERLDRDQWLRSPLYREITNVPCMIRVPGAVSGSDDRLASAIDIAPTVLDLFGVEAPDQFLGRSLGGRAIGEDGAEAEVAVTAMPLATPGDHVAVVDDVTRTVDQWQPITVFSDGWCLLFANASDPVELYDLRDDAGQERNVAGEHPALVARLHARMLDELRRGGADEASVAARS